MNYQFPRVVLFGIAVFSGWISCGPSDPKPRKQENGPSPIRPDFESYDRVLGLNDPSVKKTERFEGSFVFYAPFATTEKMERGIALSTDIKKGKYDATKFYYEKSPVYAANEKAIETAEFFLLSDAKKDEAKASVASLFEKTVFSTDNQKALFCERLIWLNACSSFFKAADQNASVSSSEKSVEPFAQCQSYYKEQGLLNPDADSNCASPKTYYQCLWGSTGVQKTTHVKADFTKANDFGEASDLAEMVKTALSKPDASFYDELLENGVFAKDIMSTFTVFEKGLMDFSSSGFSEDEVKQLKQLFQSTAASWSVYDHLFHHLSYGKSAAITRKTGIDQLFKNLLNMGLFEGSSIVANDLVVSEEALTLADQKRAENNKIKSEEAFLNGLNGPYMQARIKAGEELYRSSTVSAAFSGSYFEMTSEQDFITFTFTLASGVPDIKACYDRKSKVMRPCDGPSYAKGANKQLFSWNEQTGKMQVEITIVDPLSLNLQKKLPSSDDATYQLLPESTFLNKTLVIEMYPRRFANIVDQITGTVKLMDPLQKTTFEEGSITFYKDLRIGDASQ